MRKHDNTTTIEFTTPTVSSVQSASCSKHSFQFSWVVQNSAKHHVDTRGLCFTTYSGRQSHPIQPIRIHAYLHAYLRCLQRVQQESTQCKPLVETAQLSQCSLPTIGSARGHPVHYPVRITAYLQCLHSTTLGRHGEKWHPSRTRRPMGIVTPRVSHAKWPFSMFL